MLAIDLRKLFVGEKKIVFRRQETLFVNKKKESVFLKMKKGKHFPAV